MTFAPMERLRTSDSPRVIRVILAAYTMVAEEADVQSHRPQLIFVNEANRVVRSGPEVPGPQRRNATKGY